MRDSTFPTLRHAYCTPVPVRKGDFHLTCKAFWLSTGCTPACKWLQPWLLLWSSEITIVPHSITSQEVPAATFAKKSQQLLGLNNTVVAQLQNLTVSCGYQKIIDAATYPPKGKIPLPNGNQDTITEKCDVATLFYDAATEANPCFNICM